MIAVNREKALHLAKYFEVRVCTCDSKGWGALGLEIIDENPPSHAIAYQLRRLRRWPEDERNGTRLGLRDLQAEMEDFQPELVLVENEPWSWLRWQARWASWRAAPTAQFAEFTWENVERPGLKGCLLRWIYRAAAASGGRIICGNQNAQKLCLAAGFTAENSLVAGQLGINPEDHPRASTDERATWRNQLGWPPAAKVLGFCGRLVEEKGLIELVTATESLRQKYPDLRLALIGEGPLRPRLEAIDPTAEWLKILPAVAHQAVPAFLNKLDIFILPSKPLKNVGGQTWEEQFGHVLIEAMACGVLTLGSDSGGIPEVLADPEVTFRHSDCLELTTMIDRWLSDPSGLAAKAAKQREQASKRWSHAAVAAIYANFLHPSTP